jgi:hypothetical protein
MDGLCPQGRKRQRSRGTDRSYIHRCWVELKMPAGGLDQQRTRAEGVSYRSHGADRTTSLGPEAGLKSRIPPPRYLRHTKGIDRHLITPGAHRQQVGVHAVPSTCPSSWQLTANPGPRRCQHLARSCRAPQSIRHTKLVPKLTVRVRFPSPAPNAKSIAGQANWVITPPSEVLAPREPAPTHLAPTGAARSPMMRIPPTH